MLCSLARLLCLADLADRLVKAPPQRVAELASSTDVIAARLLRLRDIFPKVGCSADSTRSVALIHSCVSRNHGSPANALIVVGLPNQPVAVPRVS